MKPTSIIFLIVSVVLIVGGMITCTVARNIAVTDNYYLFSGSKNNEPFRNVDFSEQETTKIDLVLDNAEIRIIGGSEKSYIELYNFRDGFYNLSTAGKIITFDEILNLKSFFDLSKGLSFGGIRYLLLSEKPEGTPRINIYLNETATDNLKMIQIEGKNYSLHLENLPAFCDITLDAEESITLTADALHTSSALTVNAPSCKMTLNSLTLNTVTLKSESSYINADSMLFKSLSIETDTGEIAITAPIKLSDYTVNISDGEGRINIGGLDRPRPYYTLAPSEAAGGTVDFRSENANFSLKEITPTT